MVLKQILHLPFIFKTITKTFALRRHFLCDILSQFSLTWHFGPGQTWVDMSVCLSVCVWHCKTPTYGCPVFFNTKIDWPLPAPLCAKTQQKKHFQVLWRLWIKKNLPNIGLQRHNFQKNYASHFSFLAHNGKVSRGRSGEKKTPAKFYFRYFFLIFYLSVLLSTLLASVSVSHMLCRIFTVMSNKSLTVYTAKYKDSPNLGFLELLHLQWSLWNLSPFKWTAETAVGQKEAIFKNVISFLFIISRGP